MNSACLQTPMSLRAQRGNQENRDGEFKSMPLTMTMVRVCGIDSSPKLT